MSNHKSNNEEEKKPGSDARKSEPTKNDENELASLPSVAANGSFDLLEKERPLGTDFRMVERTRIEVGPVVRREISEADIKGLADNILEQKEKGDGIEGCGILHPLIVRPRTLLDGTIVPGYVLMKGLRRLKASELAHLDYVPVQVVDADEEKARLASIIITLTSKENSPRERAIYIVETMEKYGYSVREMAAKTGISKSVVDRAVQAIELPSDLKRAWELRPAALEHLLLLRDVQNGDLRKRLIEAVTDTTVDEENGIRPLTRQQTKEIVNGIKNVDALYREGRLDDMTALFLKQNFVAGRLSHAEQEKMIRYHLGELSEDKLFTDDAHQQRLADKRRKAAREVDERNDTADDSADAVNYSQLPIREQLGLPPLADKSHYSNKGAKDNAKQNRSLDCLAEDIYWATSELTQIASDLRQSLKMLQDLGSKLPQEHPASDEMKRAIQVAEKELALLKALLS